MSLRRFMKFMQTNGIDTLDYFGTRQELCFFWQVICYEFWSLSPFDEMSGGLMWQWQATLPPPRMPAEQGKKMCDAYYGKEGPTAMPRDHAWHSPEKQSHIMRSGQRCQNPCGLH